MYKLHTQILSWNHESFCLTHLSKFPNSLSQLFGFQILFNFKLVHLHLTKSENNKDKECERQKWRKCVTKLPWCRYVDEGNADKQMPTKMLITA
jgi:hypothetical protein